MPTDGEDRDQESKGTAKEELEECRGEEDTDRHESVEGFLVSWQRNVSAGP